MEIYIQKTEKVHITKEQQRDIALKVVEEVFYRTIRHKGFNDLRKNESLEQRKVNYMLAMLQVIIIMEEMIYRGFAKLQKRSQHYTIA